MTQMKWITLLVVLAVVGGASVYQFLGRPYYTVIVGDLDAEDQHWALEPVRSKKACIAQVQEQNALRRTASCYHGIWTEYAESHFTNNNGNMLAFLDVRHLPQPHLNGD